MKKIISLGLASAVCALTAVAASADAAKFVVDGEVENGKTVTVTLVATEDCESFVGELSVEGFAAPKADDFKFSGSFSVYKEDTKKVASFGAVKAGDTICTVTLTVTAAAGEKASLALNVIDGAAKVDKTEVEVKGAATSEPSSDSKTDSSASDSKADDSKADDKKDDTTNPGTGIALAVVPAVLAAAGVVVAKKRK